MMKMKTMSVDIVAYLWLAIEHGGVHVRGRRHRERQDHHPDALFLFIPPQSKIVSIEDTREINLPHENWIAGLTRQSGGGKGGVKTVSDIDMFELMRAAMRQRPQYLIVGEVRGKEAYTLFQAMATGKTVYSTIHADSVRSMVHRLENPPIELPRLLLSSLNLVLLQGQVKVGRQMTGASRHNRDSRHRAGDERAHHEHGVLVEPRTDVFSYNGHSFLFEKIMSAKNLTNDPDEGRVPKAHRRAELHDEDECEKPHGVRQGHLRVLQGPGEDHQRRRGSCSTGRRYRPRRANLAFAQGYGAPEQPKPESILQKTPPPPAAI